MPAPEGEAGHRPSSDAYAVQLHIAVKAPVQALPSWGRDDRPSHININLQSLQQSREAQNSSHNLSVSGVHGVLNQCTARLDTNKVATRQQRGRTKQERPKETKELGEVLVQAARRAPGNLSGLRTAN